MLADGARCRYDRLVLATGSIPTLPPIRGLVRAGRPAPRAGARVPHPGRLPPARRGRCPAPARAVVVGGGLLGLQVARALAVRGLATEVVEGGEHLLRSQVGAKAGAILARDLRRLGTEVYTGARAVRLTDDGPGARQRLHPPDRPGRAHRRRPPLDRAGAQGRARRAPRHRRRRSAAHRRRPAHPRDRRLRRSTAAGSPASCRRPGSRPACSRRHLAGEERRYDGARTRRPAAGHRPRRRRARRPGAHRGRGGRGVEPGDRLAPQARRPRRRDRRRHPGRRPVPDRADHPALRPRHRPRPARAGRPAAGRPPGRPVARCPTTPRSAPAPASPPAGSARCASLDEVREHHPRHHRLRRLHPDRPPAPAPPTGTPHHWKESAR